MKVEVDCNEDRAKLPREVDCKPLLRPLPEAPGGARTADYVGAGQPEVRFVYSRPNGLAIEHFGGHDGGAFPLGPRYDGSCEEAPWARLGKPGPPGVPPVRGFLCTHVDDSQELFVESDDCHGVVVSRSAFIQGKPPAWVLVARVKMDGLKLTREGR